MGTSHTRAGLRGDQAGEPRVVVVGAGPTGVTAAILLGQAGIATLVLDRWTEVFAKPRAVHLDDEVFRILGRLGVEREVRAITRMALGQRLLSATHATIAQFDRAVVRTANGYPQANMFDQPQLEGVLRARMRELAPLVRFVGNADVTGVRIDAEGRPTVEYVDQDGSSLTQVRPEFVLGCDGANSVVREAIGATMKSLRFKSQRWLVIDIVTDRELGHWDGVHQVCDSHRAATYMRVGATRYRWEFEMLPGESVEQYSTLDRLAPLLRPWDEDLDGFELMRVAEYTFHARVADRWRKDNVFILGDAAHLTPPFIGQGMGAGLRDAANLAWKVAAVVNGSMPASVLDSYETERIPHATTMVRLACMVGRAMTGSGVLGDRIRPLAIPALIRIPGLRERVVDSSTPPLRPSALVHRPPRRVRSLAGTLCPNVEVADGRRLDEVAAGRFSLVVTETPGHEAFARLQQLDVVVVRATSANGLRSWLGRDRVALVRPDGTVLAAGRGVDGVLRLLPLERSAGMVPSYPVADEYGAHEPQL